jgi:hypothetical protein
MAAVGGSIESVSLDGRTFAVPADAETQRNLGGFSNEVLANGDGSARIQKTRQPWSISGLQVSIDDDRGDHEFLQALANRKDFFPVAITYASGAVYQGSAIIAGGEGLQVNTQNQTAELTLSGPRTLTKQ